MLGPVSPGWERDGTDCELIYRQPAAPAPETRPMSRLVPQRWGELPALLPPNEDLSHRFLDGKPGVGIFLCILLRKGAVIIVARVINMAAKTGRVYYKSNGTSRN